MHSTTKSDRIPSAPRSSTPTVTDGDLRIVYNAVRTLVPDASSLSIGKLQAVTHLDPAVAAAAMDRVGRASRLSVHRLDTGSPEWLVRRTDR